MAALAGPKVVIDPGHGGAQAGAKGPHDMVEKRVSLALARRLAAELQKRLGAEVILTRERDVTMALPARVVLANQHHPDVFVSIHANSMPTRKLRERIEGIETFFLSAAASGQDALSTADRENADRSQSETLESSGGLSFILKDLARTQAQADSSQLAYAIHQALIRESHAVDRGVQQAPFFVLAGVEAPAVLVEVGFISHPVEGPRLLDPAYQGKLASAMASGIARFLEQRRLEDGRLADSHSPAGARGMP